MSEDFEFEDETALENQACRYAEERGVVALKLKPEGETGYPDRLFFAGASDLESGKVLFMVEFKDYGKKPNRRQRLIHESIRRTSRVPVYVVDRWSRWMEVWEKETDR